MNQEKNPTDLTVREIIRILIPKWWIIIMAAVSGTILALGVTILLITPEYESVTKMYVLTKQNENVVTSQDMQTSLSLTKDYIEMIQSRTIAEAVINQLGLGESPEKLLKKINVDSETDTRVLTISVRDSDPYVACQIANAVRDTAENHIKNVMNIDAVKILDNANISTDPVSPSARKNGVLGGFFGILISVAVILLFYMTNDYIRTPEDVERYLGLEILGEIPAVDKIPKKGRKQV
nr:Wzz/FepE/Etk N-terminal domain-containing protein [uncultured Blautia sp.]